MHLFHDFSRNPERNIGRPKGWMTDEFVKDWLAVVWKQKARGASEKMEDVGVRCIKGTRNFRNQATISHRSMNTDEVVIPAGETSQLQELYVAVNRLFKG